MKYLTLIILVALTGCIKQKAEKGKRLYWSGIDLTEAGLFRANLTRADLTEANLAEAGLSYAHLTLANLTIAKQTLTIKKDDSEVVFIEGSRHRLLAVQDYVKIGCEEHHIDYWLESFREAGKKYDYSDAQIEEYHGYLLRVDKRRKLK